MSGWAEDASDAEVEYAKVLLGRLSMQQGQSWRARAMWHGLAVEAAEELDRRRALVRELHALHDTLPSGGDAA